MILAIATLMAAGACGSVRQQALTEADYPGVLRDPAVLGRDVIWRQRVRADWGDGQHRSFKGVVQKQGDRLTVLGLSPSDSVGFAVVLHDGDIAVQNHTGQELPFPPRFILIDVQRALFPWLPEPSSRDDGVHESVIDAERVVETWRDGRLVERRFTRVDGQPAGDIVVRYAWGHDDQDRMWMVPMRIALDNEWCGYRLTIDTLDETLIGPATGMLRATPASSSIRRSRR